MLQDGWPTAMLDAAALDFAIFSNKLATALHASGRRLGLDLSGDSDRPIGVFPAFGAHAKDVDYFTLMSTYSYYDIKRPGHSDYNDYLMVLDALKGGIPAAKIGCVRAATNHLLAELSSFPSHSLRSLLRQNRVSSPSQRTPTSPDGTPRPSRASWSGLGRKAWGRWTSGGTTLISPGRWTRRRPGCWRPWTNFELAAE